MAKKQEKKKVETEIEPPAPLTIEPAETEAETSESKFLKILAQQREESAKKAADLKAQEDEALRKSLEGKAKADADRPKTAREEQEHKFHAILAKQREELARYGYHPKQGGK